MDTADPDDTGRDSAWDQAERKETTVQRLDRNWGDLLQELRVVQTGVQLLTGFLLTLPFQARFATISRFDQNVYLATVAAAVAATAFLIAPVSVHRLLFRRHARRVMVLLAHRLALVGMVLLGCAVVGVVLLIVDVLRGRAAAIVGAGATAVVVIALWLVLPLAIRHSDRAPTDFG